VKPIPLLNYSRELVKAGKFPDGETEVPFEFKLEPMSGGKLYETYHGVFVNTQYLIRVEMARSMFAKNLQKQLEFIVECTPEERSPEPVPEPIEFDITPASLENVKKEVLKRIPQFSIKGRIDSNTCNINKPLTGELVIAESEVVVRSIEIQLVRVETCGCADGYAKEATEIQNIQIADGDLQRGVPVPIFMVFPRLFTAPTLSTRTFKIEFEVNVVVMLQDGHLITENFPIKLVRCDAADSIGSF
jgi:vacuolar protein sorting-associated protein 26C